MRLFIGGDIVPTEVTRPFFDRSDLSALFGSTTGLVRSGDRVIANLECALTGSNTPIRKCGPNLRGKPADARVLRDFGLTDIGLANNHVFDYGQPGYQDTLRALTAAGLRFTGCGENEQAARQPLFLNADGQRVALIAVAEHEYSYALPDQAGVWGFDPFETMADIAKAKDQADLLIVAYHGGKEQSPYPSPRLRKACQAMARAGADVVLCQHSHCIGVYEQYQGAHLLYGQGNFNFVGHSDHAHWQSGLLVQLDRYPDGRTVIEFHPVVVTKTGVTLAEGPEKAALLAGLQERSLILQDEARWLAEWHAFCVSVAPGYRRAVADAFADPAGLVPAQIFPHYLDCEAHLDVWHELYPTWHREKTDEANHDLRSIST